MRDCRIGKAVLRKFWGALRQCFEESDAERPDVGFWSEGGGRDFGGIVNVTRAGKLVDRSNGGERIGGKFQTILSGEEVGRLEMSVGEALGVEIDKDIESGVENVSRFVGRQGALGKDFREIFFRVLHNDIEQRLARAVEAAAIVNGEEIFVRELRGAFPGRESGLCRWASGRNKF